MDPEAEFFPASTQYNVTLHIVLPLPDHGYKDIIDLTNDDIDLTLRQIERELLVKFDTAWDGSSVTIYAFTTIKAKEALSAVQKLLEKRKNEASVWHPRILMAVHMDRLSGLSFELIAEVGRAGRRPVIKTLLSPAGGVDLKTTVAYLSYERQLRAALNLICANVRVVPNKMRMRVHFGKLSLLEWKKDKDEYSASELEDLFSQAGHRGTARLDELVGAGDIVKDIHDGLSSSKNMIVPLRVGHARFNGVRPTYSVVLMTKAWSIESAIETSQKSGPVQANGLGPREYCFSPFQIFRREDSHRAVEIMTSCPEGFHDWMLEVHNQLSLTETRLSVPFTAQSLQKSAVFTGSTLPGTFPCFKLQNHFITTNKIENIVGKVSWTYLLDTKYSVELHMYYKWGRDTALKPVSGAGVSLYSDDWDDVMQAGNLALGPRAWDDFGEVFLRHDSPGSSVRGRDWYEDFLSRVEAVQEILNKAKLTQLKRQQKS